MVAWSYVWLVVDLASNLSMSMSTGSKRKKMTYRDVEESPARNGSSLRDGLRVPEQIKDRQKCEAVVAEGRGTHCET